MSVYGIGNVITPQTQTTQNKSTLNVQDFLKLITAQMNNLDPAGGNSTNSSEYFSQMAQFTMLEQINNLAESLKNLSVLSQQQMSFSMVGKTATVVDGDKEIRGVVESVRYKNGLAYPVIGGAEYSMSMVKEIGEE
jgi:flagellar basal-body rod modification protein FlgD